VVNVDPPKRQDIKETLATQNALLYQLVERENSVNGFNDDSATKTYAKLSHEQFVNPLLIFNFQFNVPARLAGAF
jgi:hypothetical protein